MANVIDIIVRGQDQASKVLERVAKTAETAFKKAELAVKRLDNMKIDPNTTAAVNKLDLLKKKAIEAAKNRNLIIQTKVDKAIKNVERLRQNVDQLGKRSMEVGENMFDMGENLMQGLSLPLGILGGAAFKASADANRMMTILRASVGGVKERLEQVLPIAQRVFKQGLGVDVEEVARVTGMLKMKFSELNQTQLQDITTKVLSLSKALGIDTSTSITTVSNLMEQYKISANQALDLVAAGYSETDLSVASLTKGMNKNATAAQKNRAAHEAVRKKLNEVKGAAGEAAKAMEDDTWTRLLGKWRELLDALKPLGDKLIELAEKWLPKIKEKAEEAAKAFDRLSDSQQNLLVKLGGLLFSLPFIAIALGSIASIAGIVMRALGVIFSPFMIAAALVGSVLMNIWHDIKMVGNSLDGAKQQWVTAWNLIKNATNQAATAIVNWFTSMKNRAIAKWNELWNWITNKAQAAKNRAVALVGQMASWISAKWASIKSSAASAWAGVYSAIVVPIENAASRAIGLIQSIQRAISGVSFSGKHLTGLGSMGISWHAKGGVFDGPSVIGVGEQPGVKEAVIPLSGSNMRPFARQIAKEMGGGGEATINISFPNMVVREEADIRKIIREIDRTLKIHSRAGGIR